MKLFRYVPYGPIKEVGMMMMMMMMMTMMMMTMMMMMMMMMTVVAGHPLSCQTGAREQWVSFYLIAFV